MKTLGTIPRVIFYAKELLLSIHSFLYSIARVRELRGRAWRRCDIIITPPALPSFKRSTRCDIIITPPCAAVRGAGGELAPGRTLPRGALLVEQGQGVGAQPDPGQHLGEHQRRDRRAQPPHGGVRQAEHTQGQLEGNRRQRHRLRARRHRPSGT
eukprot:9232303-Pyramimonas_sp.AAC.1